MKRRDFVIFTVVNHYGGIYVVSLDEYDEQVAYVLEEGEFDIGDRSVGEVTCIVGNNIIVDTINGLSDKDKKLFMLCYKLIRTLDGPQDGWAKVCRDAIFRNIEHPYDLITNRSFIDDRPEIFPKEYNDCIIRNHARLFGIEPFVLIEKIGISALHDDVVVEKLNKVISEFNWMQYTSEELYQDWNRYNIHITPLALPVFEIKVSAYLVSRCFNVISDVMNRFKEYVFDVIER